MVPCQNKRLGQWQILCPDTGRASNQRDRVLTGRAALSYRFSDGLVGYLGYATSFLPQAGLDAAGRGYRPLEASQWEFGVKYGGEGAPFTFAASVFDLRQRNALIPDPNPGNICFGLTGPDSCMVQSGEQRRRGLEVEAAARLGERTTFLGAVTLLDAEITASNGPDLGMVPVNIPRRSASL